jgi:hypothetical protein
VGRRERVKRTRLMEKNMVISLVKVADKARNGERSDLRGLWV